MAVRVFYAARWPKAFKIGGMRPLRELSARLKCDRRGLKEARLTVLSPPAVR